MRAADRDEAVLGVVEIGVGAVARQVAIRVVGERRAAGGGVLVEPVDGVSAVDRIGAGPGIGVVVAGARDDLVRRIVAEGRGDIAAGVAT
jgi:hypothetical protein